MATLEIVPDGGISTPPALVKLLRIRRPACLLAYIGAICYAQFIFSTQNMEHTRISEHALMPGLVTSRFDRQGYSVQVARDLKDLPRNKSQQEFICSTFEELGVECYQQRWTTKVKAQKMSGRNVYAWVRAPRASGDEAMLVAVRLGRRDAQIAALAHVISFASFAKDQVYWARDIVFVFVDGESLSAAVVGMDAFLSSYFLVKDRAIEADLLHGEGGYLIAGIVYEMAPKHGERNRCSMTAKINGINGQLPNLDLFNSAVRISDNKHRCEMLIYDVPNDGLAHGPFGLLIPMRAIFTQAFVSTEGLHSVMGKYSLQGLTIGLSHSYSPELCGSYMEAMARTLNNALERLHQSYFMYVLADEFRFSSIAFYMPMIGLLVAPLLMNAYFEWSELTAFEISPFLLVQHSIGATLLLLSRWLLFDVGSEIAVLQSEQFPFVMVVEASPATRAVALLELKVALFAAGASLIPWGLVFKRKIDNLGSMRMIVQLEAALVLGCLALLNFGLATIVALVAVPVIINATQWSLTWPSCALRTGLHLVFHPLAIVAYFIAFGRPYFEYADRSVEPSFEMMLKSMSRMLKENVLHGSHLFALYCLFAVPLWNILVGVVTRREDKSASEITEETSK